MNYLHKTTAEDERLFLYSSGSHAHIKQKEINKTFNISKVII